MSITNTEYNGWKNFETWNIALWIGNNETLHEIAKYYKDYEKFRQGLITPIAMRFIKKDRELQNIAACCEVPIVVFNSQTPDNISYWTQDLDIDALTEAIKKL